MLYKLVSTLVSMPHQMTVLILDLEARFDATRLTCPNDDLCHVYIQRPARLARDHHENPENQDTGEHLRSLVADAGAFMLYGAAALPQASGTRRWWGTIVIGGYGVGDVTTGWRGWLRVDREQVRGFSAGTSAEEALEQRSQRQAAADNVAWSATSPWGNFILHE